MTVDLQDQSEGKEKDVGGVRKGDENKWCGGRRDGLRKSR